MSEQLQRSMAIMSFLAYRPSLQNDIDLISSGWEINRDLSRSNRGNGFDGTVFRSITGQVIVAFRGTDADGAGPFLSDVDDDVEIAAGWDSEQVERAIELVSDVLAEYPDADVQFTGHSLGGGLASLMAVFFDKPAYVFAHAPFEYSAVNTEVDIDVISYWPPRIEVSTELVDSELVQQYFIHYWRYQVAKGRRDSIDPAFQEYSSRFASGLVQGRALYAVREQRVSGTFINGEAVQALRARLPAIGASNIEPIDVGNTSLSHAPIDSIELHSMLLHAAMVSAEQLPQASRNLPFLLEMLLDGSLYAQGNSSPTPGFLNQLLNESYSDASEPDLNPDLVPLAARVRG